MNNKQSAKIQLNLAKLQQPAYYELKSNRNYFSKNKPKRGELAPFQEKMVNFTGTLIAIKLYHNKKTSMAHLLIKPAVVANKHVDHIWCRVTRARFGRIQRQQTSHFNKCVHAYGQVIYYTDRTLTIHGRGVIHHYLRQPNKQNDLFTTDYGLKDAKWISVTSNDSKNK